MSRTEEPTPLGYAVIVGLVGLAFWMWREARRKTDELRRQIPPPEA